MIGVINDEDLSDIVLVSHSHGGMVISAVAGCMPEKFASLGLSRRRMSWAGLREDNPQRLTAHPSLRTRPLRPMCCRARAQVRTLVFHNA